MKRRKNIKRPTQPWKVGDLLEREVVEVSDDDDVVMRDA